MGATPTPATTKAAKVALAAATVLAVVYAAMKLGTYGQVGLIDLALAWATWFVIVWLIALAVIAGIRAVRS